MNQPRASVFTGLFLSAFGTVAYELVLTRLFSVTMWYHFAFLAVSLAMFGMTVGALVIDLWPDRFPEQGTEKQMCLGALGFSIASIIAFLTHLSVPLILDADFLSSAVGLFAVVFTCVVLSVPFVFSGIVVCLALTRYRPVVAKLYAADLTGAAFACLFVVYELAQTSAMTTLVFCGAISALAAICFALASGATKGSNLLRAGVAAFIVIGLGGVANMEMPLLKQSEPLRLVWIKGLLAPTPLYDAWNAFSYIRVIGDPVHPAFPRGWGLDPKWVRPPFAGQLALDIDGGAATYITRFNGDLQTVRYLKCDVTNIGEYLKSGAKVLVMGAGGGRDVLSAIVFGQKDITGVEINPNIIEAVLDVFGDFSGHLDKYPGVKFVNDEARSYVTRSNEKFDLIQLSLIDTWAATASGAFALSENSLYTVDAWKTITDHLSDRGIFTVSRWYSVRNPAEIMRTVSLGAAVLRSRGVESPRQNMMLIRYLPKSISGEQGEVGIGTLLLCKSAFTPAELQTINRTAAELGFDIMIAPNVVRDDALARICDSSAINRIQSELPYRIDPPTDDSPYFMQLAKLSTVFNPQTWKDYKLWISTMPGLAVLAGLTILLSMLVLSCVFVPLQLRGPKLRSTPASLRLLAFFLLIGFAFMFVEISQIQRLSVFLGHPTYGLSVVLFSMLVFSGIGSLASAKLELGPLRFPAARIAAIVLVLVIIGVATPAIMHSFATAPIATRVLLSICLLAPMGFFMGMALPTGMTVAAQDHADMMPWFWALNGAASVLGSVLATLLSICSSISITYFAAALLYAFAAAAITCKPGLNPPCGVASDN